MTSNGPRGLTFLLDHGLLLRRKGGARIALNSERNGRSLRRGCDSFGISYISTLITIFVSAQTTVFATVWVGALNFNSLSIIDDSVVGCFNNQNVVSRPVDVVGILAILRFDFLLLILSNSDILSININFIFFSTSRLKGDFRAMCKDLNMLLAIDKLSKNSMGSLLGAISSKDMVTVIKVVRVGFVIKCFDCSISNIAFGIHRASMNFLADLPDKRFTSMKGENSPETSRETNVRYLVVPSSSLRIISTVSNWELNLRSTSNWFC